MAESEVNAFEKTPVKHCSLCLDNDDLKNAVKYCVDCGSHLCCECLKHHKKFPVLKSHKVLDNLEGVSEEVTTWDGNVGFDCCTHHHGEALESYCKEHDEICCIVCVSIRHRSCENVVSLEDAAKEIQETTELDKAQKCLETSITRIKLETEKRINNISNLDEEKLSIVQEIDVFQDNIKQKIKEMGDASKEEVRSKHRELVNAVKKDIKQLEKVASVQEKSLKTLNSSVISQSKLFTNIKRSDKIVKDAETLVKDLPSKWPIRKLNFCIDYKSPHNDSTLKTFGHIIDDENVSSYILGISQRYKGVFNVKVESDRKDCVVSGICLLNNDMYGICDNANCNFKRFNKTYEMYDSIDLEGAPSSACISGPQEVAVTLHNERMIKFISCSDKLSLGDSFSTENGCFGVAFDSERKELFVTTQNLVYVYTKDGILLRKFEQALTAEKKIYYLKKCVVAPGSEILYVADAHGGLYAINKINGDLIWTLLSSKFEKAWGVCLISSQHLLVGDSVSCNVILVNGDGTFNNEILEKETGVKKLYTKAYDRKRSKIMLGGISNEIFTYPLCRK